jgi:hypothetical protein
MMSLPLSHGTVSSPGMYVTVDGELVVVGDDEVVGEVLGGEEMVGAAVIGAKLVGAFVGGVVGEYGS